MPSPWNNPLSAPTATPLAPIALPTQLAGFLVTLRKHELSQAQIMFDYVDRDRERLARFLPWVPFIKSAEDEAAFIARTHAEWDQFETFDYSIHEKHSGTYVGNIGVHTIAWKSRAAELGYWILGDFESKGFITDAVKSLEAALFAVGFNRVTIRCNQHNARSAAVPKRCGYHLDGIMREDFIENGTFRSTMVYSKLASEFQSNGAR